MAKNPPVPPVNAVITTALRKANPAAVFNPVTTSFYSTPLHGNCQQTYQRADGMFATGLVPDQQDIRNVPDDPVSTNTGNWHYPNGGRALTIDEMLFNVDKHLSTSKYKFFTNLQGIVNSIIQRRGGPAAFAAATPAQNIAIFRQFCQQDPFNVTRAMFHGAGANAINIDVIFNSQHVNQIPFSQNTGFDQVVVLRHWFEYFFEESCQIVGRRYF